MADEAIKVNGPYEVQDFTVAAGTTIAKGTVCQLTDPRTASASSAAGQIFAGIAASEKNSSDSSTTLGLYTRGIFDMKVTASTGAVTVGEKVVINGANTITRLATTGLEPDDIKLVIGTALETGSAGEIIEVDIGRR